jgi:hypothetical protein
MVELQIPEINARTRMGKATHPIIDLVSGKTAGFIKGHNGSGLDTFPPWVISLFDGKYSKGFSRREECVAFAKGVEAVLNHMTSIGEENSSTKAA